MKILGKAIDQRTKTRVVYAQMAVDEYLNLVGPNFDEFAIQRRREKHRGYARLKSDAAAGALLPSITLAYDPKLVIPLQQSFDANDEPALIEALGREQGRVSILDGLQRTYILSEIRDSGKEFKLGQTLLVEFWLEDDPRNLIYRIIVLNAGQKPMSMRHQIEVLFSTFKSLLESEIPQLTLLTEREGTRRVRSRKYGLDKVATAYQAFLLKGPEVQKENVVAQRIVEEDVLGADEDSLNRTFTEFKKTLNDYAQLDDDVCRVYDGSEGAKGPKGTDWFGGENVMLGFFAAVADFASRPDRVHRANTALESLKSTLRTSQVGEDPLGLETLEQVIKGFNTKRVNVGFATRKLLFNSFKEFFREAGEKPIAEVWLSEAD
jgi:hypothetical protein